MNTCKHCNDTLFTEIYDTCMTCFEKNHTQANMTKTIDQYQGESMWYQKEIINLQNELECYKKNGDVKSDVVKRQKDILDKTLFELPVGSIKNHTYESIPGRVKHYVQIHADLQYDIQDATNYVEQSMPNFQNLSMYETVVKLIEMLNKAHFDALEESEKRERLEEEIKSLKNELECWINNGDVKSRVVQRQKDILDKTLFELPVGSIKNHTYESIPDRVKYFVREHAILEQEKDAVDELIAKTMPNFFDNPKAGSILDNVTILIEMVNDAMVASWADREALEALQQEIEVFYEYYAGFGAKKGLTTTQMLNHILQSVPNYKPTKEEYDLEDMKRHCYHYIEALTEITKKNRKAETCRMIALKALGELNHQDHQPELLIEENLKLRMELEDVQSKLADAVLDKTSVAKPKSTLDDIKPPTYGGEVYCSHCKKFHWGGNVCSHNPQFQKYNYTEDLIHPLTDCQDCGKHWDYHHEEHCEAKKL